jgi:Htaa
MNLHFSRPFGARLIGTVIAVIALAGAVTVAASARGGDGGEEAVEIEGGATLLTVDPGTLEALTGAGFAVEPIEPAQVSQAASGEVTFAFPIKWGWLAASDLSGKIKHRGGLSFSKGGTTVGVKNFVIDTSEGVLTAQLVGSRERIPLLTLDLTNLQAFVFDDSAVLRGVGATLTEEAATALNAAFETDLFAEGLTIGTAEVFAILDD